MLVVWQNCNLVYAEDGLKYHFALYSSSLGWCGYYWDRRCGKPLQILPATSSTVWVYISTGRLMRLEIEKNGEAIITDEITSGLLIGADRDSCLVKGNKRGKVRCLRFGKLGDFDAWINAVWAHFLPDGAIVMKNAYGRDLILLSSNGEIVHQEMDTPHVTLIIAHLS